MKYWQYHNQKIKELKQIYNRTNKQTQNKLQEIFDSFKVDFNSLYHIADNKTKNKVNTYIEEWRDKGLLKGYFGMLANNIYKRTRIKNSEILELLIYGAYIEEQSKLKEIELNTFKEVANHYYQQGQEEVNESLPKKKRKIVSVISDAIFLALLDMPNYSGYNWEKYIQTILQYNVQQLYKQVILNIQQQRELEIQNDEFQRIINQQNNQRLCIKENKISGFTDTQMIGINNLAKVEGIKEKDNNAKIKFIAVTDGKETDMCHSLDGQEFYIGKENQFDRYYGETKNELRIQRIKCKGLVQGLNLPPISHHFHWCRSTIRYLPTKESNVEETEDEDILQYLDINNYVRKDITKQKNKLIRQAFKNEEIRMIALRNDIKKIYIYGKQSKHKANNIYFNTEWKHKKQSQKDRTIRHEIGHAIDYKYNYISCKGELSTALEIDKQNLLKHKEKLKQTLKSKEYKEYAELSDIIGGLTNNQIRGKYYHRDSYWKKENTLEKETFANLFAIIGKNDKEYLLIVKQYLPNTLKIFEELIRRIK